MDLVAYFHGDSVCEDVWASIEGSPTSALERLGTLADYSDASAVDLIEQSHFVSDLTQSEP